jgi:transposase
VLPGEKLAAQMVHILAKEVMALNENVSEIDKLIKDRFRERELAEVMSSMPGIGPCSAPSSLPPPAVT